jgi:hypothetical protein
MNGPLFDLDDAAELRALAAADLPDPEQVAVEATRAALALGARRVAVAFGRRGFTLVAEGAALPAAEAAGWELALDRGAGAGARARAVESLLGSLAAPLVALLHESVQAVRWNAAPLRLEVELRGASAASARERLRSACRYAPVPVRVDGTGPPASSTPAPANPGGLPSHAAWRALPAPEAGLLALLPESEAARATLLVHGVVRATQPLPATLPFEAVVECAAGVDWPDAAALRERAAARAAAWDELALELLLAALGQPPADPGRDATLAALFLRAAEAGRLGADWGARPALVVRDGARRERVSVDALAARGAEPLAVVEPGALPRAEALELAVPARAALARLRGLRFEDVTDHPAGATWRARWRGLLDRLGAAAGRVAAREPLPQRALGADERQLLAALQREWGAPCHLVEGGGRPQRSRRGIALPRRAPDVALAARALATDPGLARVAAALLRPPQRE